MQVEKRYPFISWNRMCEWGSFLGPSPPTLGCLEVTGSLGEICCILFALDYFIDVVAAINFAVHPCKTQG